MPSSACFAASKTIGGSQPATTSSQPTSSQPSNSPQQPLTITATTGITINGNGATFKQKSYNFGNCGADVIQPVLWRTMGFEGVPEAHQLMLDNKHLGKIAILVGATETGLGNNAEGPGAIYAEVGA